ISDPQIPLTRQKKNASTSHVALLTVTLANTGPQGPAGATGATGPIGPAGPAGATRAAGVSGYQQGTSSYTIMPESVATNIVACPSGKVVTGGGVTFSTGGLSGSTIAAVTVTHPSSRRRGCAQRSVPRGVLASRRR